MRWMWIMMGLLAGAAALTLLGAWSRKVRRTSKGEVSLMAAVKRARPARRCVLFPAGRS